MKMDTVVKSRESSRVLDCSSQSTGFGQLQFRVPDDGQPGSWGAPSSDRSDLTWQRRLQGQVSAITSVISGEF